MLRGIVGSETKSVISSCQYFTTVIKKIRLEVRLILQKYYKIAKLQKLQKLQQQNLKKYQP